MAKKSTTNANGIEIVSHIYKTNNYGMFHFDERNRDTIKSHKKVLAQSIKRKDLADDRPILVVKSGNIYMILDGQNRFEVRKELGLPIFFKESSVSTIMDVATMNSDLTRWKLNDYVKCFANNGNKEYIKLTQYVDKFDGLSVGSAIRILGYYDRGSQLKTTGALTNANVKAGNFMFVNTNNNHITDTENIREIGSVFKKPFHRTILSVYLSHLKKTDKFDQKRMMSQIEKYRNDCNPVNFYSSVKELAEHLNDIYNYKMAKSKKVRFAGLNKY